MKEITFGDNGLVERKYTEAWVKSSLINMDYFPDLVRQALANPNVNDGIIPPDKIPALAKTLVTQRREMIAYIESLHDKLDFIMRKNNICDMPQCHTANCSSDHK